MLLFNKKRDFSTMRLKYSVITRVIIIYIIYS